MKSFLKYFIVFLFITCSGNIYAQSNPQVLDSNISISRIMTVKNGVIRLAKDPVSHQLFYILTNGNVYQVMQPSGGPAYDSLVFDTLNHGVFYVQGMAFFDSTLYISGNNHSTKALTYGIIVRGKLQPNGTRIWDTLMHTVNYQTADYFDHLFSGLTVSPAGDTIYVCSGARGDHGEIQTRYGAYPGLRNVPLTTNIYCLPTHDSAAITLQNDSAWLDTSGYLFCRGVRNHFDMAFDSNGNFFGVENSGDRDHNEEMNWLRRGHHYGFPWTMGGTDNPQQFPSFNPATDKLINHYSRSWKNGFWNNDPTYPPVPAGIVFDEPMLNYGPDCDKFRDSTGAVHDASDSGIAMGTFTAHRSPLGLVFDNLHVIAQPYRGDAFMLSWTKGYDSCGCSPPPDSSIGPFVDPSQDLVHLDISYDSSAGNFRLNATRVIAEFEHPVDADIDSNKIYVIENGYGGTSGLYEVVFPLYVPPLPCNPVAGVNIPSVCFPDSNSVSIPAFGTLPDRVSWYDSTGNLLRADSGLFSADTFMMFPSGNFYAVINDSGTCGIDTLSFIIPEAISIQVDTVFSTTCIGCNDGIIIFHRNGGTSPFLYFINPSTVTITGDTITGLAAGNYILCVTDGNGCVVCDSAIILDDPLSVPSIWDNNNFIVFPNPANETATIRFNGAGNISVKLLDMNGRQIKLLMNENLKQGEHELSLNCSELSNGCYTVEITTERRTFRKLILIN